jgi:hypothetical protein
MCAIVAWSSQHCADVIRIVVENSALFEALPFAAGSSAESSFIKAVNDFIEGETQVADVIGTFVEVGGAAAWLL